MNGADELSSQLAEADNLQTAVFGLAQTAVGFSDADLDQPWAWGPYNEGARFALLGAYQELRELAVRVGDERRLTGPPTAAQQALAQYHAAYRDLQAILLGLDEALYEREPGPGEWPVTQVLLHIIRAEQGFFALVHYGLRRQREGGALPQLLPDGEVERLLGRRERPRELLLDEGLREMMAYYDALHGRALREFGTMGDEELLGPSLWWENIRFPLQHRLHRFDAHLRQHTIQIEKTLDMLAWRETEARRLVRLLFNALAGVEGLLIGAPSAALTARRKLAAALLERTAEIEMVIDRAHRLREAVIAGDARVVEEILEPSPALVDARDEQGLPLVMTAVYHRQPHMAALLRERGARLDLFAAAALGDLELVRSEIEAYPEDIDAFGRDGFTPLQLACYFGHAPLVQWLIEKGADVAAVSRNAMHLQAIHAAVANDSFANAGLLLEHGADADAVQAQGVTPLQAAARNGNPALVTLLLDHGADPRAANDEGKTAFDLAANDGIRQQLQAGSTP